MKGLYDVRQIAHFIVNYSNKSGKPISNLQLQKLLYFLWIEYYKMTKQYLFADEFSAWKFGPVIPEVYYEFCAYGGLPITEFFDVELKQAQSKNNDEESIIKFVDKYSAANPFDLVSESHKQGHSWDLVFNKRGKGTGNRTPISFELIIQKECLA
ncbi:MAG: DUF4065 domain-containing protein [Clostridia bacterium]|nr:DUF4065 domain-containing protein [Clostridia bacterium]MBR2175332.1 DUF4065 domain-containing protein [Clostridia bacterium]